MVSDPSSALLLVTCHYQLRKKQSNTHGLCTKISDIVLLVHLTMEICKLTVDKTDEKLMTCLLLQLFAVKGKINNW